MAKRSLKGVGGVLSGLVSPPAAPRYCRMRRTNLRRRASGRTLDVTSGVTAGRRIRM